MDIILLLWAKFIPHKKCDGSLVGKDDVATVLVGKGPHNDVYITILTVHFKLVIPNVRKSRRANMTNFLSQFIDIVTR